jgi:hypothetical protein
MNKNRFIKNNKSKNNKTRKNKKNRKNYYKKTQKTIIRNKKGGSRCSKVYKKIRHRKINRKFTKKIGGGIELDDIRLFIDDKLQEIKEPVKISDTVESLLNRFKVEGNVSELIINSKQLPALRIESQLGAELHEIGVVDHSKIRVKLDKKPVHNRPKPKVSIPPEEFRKVVAELSSTETCETPKMFNEDYWNEIQQELSKQLKVTINKDTDKIFLGMGSGRQYMNDPNQISEVYNEKYEDTHTTDTGLAPTSVQQLHSSLRKYKADNLGELEISDESRIIIINLDQDINCYSNEPVLTSYLKLKFGNELLDNSFDDFIGKIKNEHNLGKGVRDNNNILIHSLLENKIVFISVRCVLDLKKEHDNYPKKVIGFDDSNTNHESFET